LKASHPTLILGKGSQDKGEVNEEDVALVWVAGRNSEFTVYDFLQVLEATNNFSEENKLGQGGFGPVYKVREKKLYALRTQNKIEKKPSKRTSLGHVWDEREVFP
jgi:hypothetical protein